MSNPQAPDTFDYMAAGKAQILIAIVAFMQCAYWFGMGHAAAVRAARVSSDMIQYMDWACAALALLALVPLFRGIFLYRKGRRQHFGPKA